MTKSRRAAWQLCAGTLLLATVPHLFACSLATPQLRSPGSLMDQRFRAVMYDPYADVDVAPEVVGGRPKDFQRPLSQADRSDLVSQQLTPYLPTPR